MKQTTTKSTFLAAIAFGTIAFAVASTNKAIAHEVEEWNGYDTIDISPQWVDMDKMKRKLAAKKRAKRAIAEMESNPHFINLAKDNYEQIINL